MHTGVVGTCRIRSLLARYSRSTHSSQISLLHCFQGIRMRGLTAHAGEKQVSHAPCSRNTCRIPAFRCSKRRQACTVRNAIVQSSVVNVASVENKTSENKKSRPGEKKGKPSHPIAHQLQLVSHFAYVLKTDHCSAHYTVVAFYSYLSSHCVSNGLWPMFSFAPCRALCSASVCAAVRVNRNASQLLL